MKPLRPLLLVVACALPALAAAQWQWLDKDGRKVFSDRAPPADIPQNRILRQPSGAPVPAAAEAPAAAATTTAAAAASAPKLSGKDKELEAKKKQMEAEDAAKKKAEQDKLAAARAENCARAKTSKAGLEAGTRVARTNEKGEREFLDDKQREAEIKRIQEIINKDCAPA